MGDWQTHIGVRLPLTPTVQLEQAYSGVHTEVVLGCVLAQAPTNGETPIFKTIPGSTSGQIREGVEVAGSGITTYQAYDEAVAAATSDWLHAYSASEAVAQPRRRPFAAVAGFVLPHCPFFAPKPLFDYYYERVNVPALESDTDQPRPIRRWRANRDMAEPLTEHQVRVARAAYLGLCEHLDHQIGKVLAALEESGLAENTLVIYCSDHGEVAGERECIKQSCHSRCL
jgi:choline-sulfatase